MPRHLRVLDGVRHLIGNDFPSEIPVERNRVGIEKRKGTVVFPHARETPDHQLFHDALAGVFRVGADAGDKTDGIADTVDIHVQRINREL